MSKEWYWVYVSGIMFGGSLILLSIGLAWARYLKRWWGREMNRETVREWEENGDANASK